VAADQIRRHQRSPRVGGDWELELEARRSSPGPSGVVELHAILRALDSQRREAFVLTRVVGLSYEEAAQTMGCAIGTIRSCVFRARAELLAALSQEHGSTQGSAPWPDRHCVRPESTAGNFSGVDDDLIRCGNQRDRHEPQAQHHPNTRARS
jgi:predicted DNA-binding protein (UPF0251 family)